MKLDYTNLLPVFSTVPDIFTFLYNFIEVGVAGELKNFIFEVSLQGLTAQVSFSKLLFLYLLLRLVHSSRLFCDCGLVDVVFCACFRVVLNSRNVTLSGKMML